MIFYLKLKINFSNFSLATVFCLDLEILPCSIKIDNRFASSFVEDFFELFASLPKLSFCVLLKETSVAKDKGVPALTFISETMCTDSSRVDEIHSGETPTGIFIEPITFVTTTPSASAVA